MTFRQAIDRYVEDMVGEGRFNSPRTVLDYRRTLVLHADDVGNRDPRTTNREDCNRTLSRWEYANSRAKARSQLVSFYRWAMEEGHRKDNPAEQTRRPRRREPKVVRLTRSETVALLKAARGERERRLIYVGTCAGLRRAELVGLQGRHFTRPGFVWVSSDIAKGGDERWVPVIADLAPVVEEIRENVAPDEYVLPAQRFRNVGINTERIDYVKHPGSPKALWELVKTVAKRAELAQADKVGPHAMRRAFADHVARFAGERMAQAALGHKELSTTEDYLSAVAPDDLAAALERVSFGLGEAPPALPLVEVPANPLKAPTGIEPVNGASRALERILAGLFASPVLREAAHGS